MSNYSSPAPASLQQKKTNKPTNKKPKGKTKTEKKRHPKGKTLENPERKNPKKHTLEKKNLENKNPKKSFKSLRKNRNAQPICFRFGTSFYEQQCHHFLQAFGTYPCE
jgi:hypothetical protein